MKKHGKNKCNTDVLTFDYLHLNNKKHKLQYIKLINN